MPEGGEEEVEERRETIFIKKFNNISDLVTKSLEYHDSNQEKYSKLKSKFRYYKIERSSNDLESSKILFYDKNKKKIFSSRYQILGIYENSSKLWVWGWGVLRYGKPDTKLATEILNYGLNLNVDVDSLLLKTYLINCKNSITSRVLLDIFVSIASYLTKTPLVYELQSSFDILEEESGKEKDIYELDKMRYYYGDKTRYLSTYMYLLDVEEE